MRKRRKVAAPQLVLLVLSSVLLVHLSSALMLLKSSCLSSSPSCNCSWKSGKFVANCSNQGLKQVPKNDYYDFLVSNSGNNQMSTLNRDIQQLHLSSNNISILKNGEFGRKKFRNLQKIFLNGNEITQIHSSAFYKLTGLVELDLSENSIGSLNDEVDEQNDLDPSEGLEEDLKRRKASRNSSMGCETGSFLQDLVQLRQLNLASNKLSRLGSFVFSCLTQLRQLLLSRNQISFIDKSAFDGLNVLNILHLDGNKLSYLDGEILLKLPKLYSIQLAGSSNLWRCDCRLRKLVRYLLPPTGKERAQWAQEEPIRANMLQDEPACAGPTHSGVGRAWSSMKFSDFACAPKVASQFIAPPVGSHKYNWKQGNMETVMNSNDNKRRIELKLQYFTADEPIELTCALALVDELDLEFVQLHWLQPDQKTTFSSTHTGYRDDSVAIIDYVTRVNGSSDQEDAQRLDASSTTSSYVRVMHLIVEPLAQTTPTQKEFVCRITNQQLGATIDILFPISLDSTSTLAQLAAAKREALRKRAGQFQYQSDQARWIQTSWPLERAKSALASAMSEPDMTAPNWPFFLPIQLPDSLPRWTAQSGGLLELASLPTTQAGQRPSTRQTAAPTNGPHNTTSKLSQNSEASLQESLKPDHSSSLMINSSSLSLSARRLNLVALGLISRFTSNKQALMDLWQLEPEQEAEISQAQATLMSLKNPTDQIGTIQLTRFYNLYLDRWLQVAMSEAHMLLAVCAGLLLGCLLTMLIVFRLRSANVNQHRVTDLEPTRTPPAKSQDQDYDGAPSDEAHSSSANEKSLRASSGTSTNNSSQRALIQPTYDLSSVATMRNQMNVYNTFDSSDHSEEVTADAQPYPSASNNQRRLIVVSPEKAEIQELMISPYCSEQHESLANLELEFSDADSSLILAQLDQCQRAGFLPQDQWPNSCEEVTVEDSSVSSLMLTNKQHHLQPWTLAQTTRLRSTGPETCHRHLPRANQLAPIYGQLQCTPPSMVSPAASSNSSATGSHCKDQQIEGEEVNGNLVHLDHALRLLKCSMNLRLSGQLEHY